MHVHQVWCELVEHNSFVKVVTPSDAAAAADDDDDDEQRRRSVVKYGGRGHSGQAIKLFQAPRKIRFTFHFWHKSFIPDVVKHAQLSTNSFRMKECDILGVKHTLTPPS